MPMNADNRREQPSTRPRSGALALVNALKSGADVAAKVLFLARKAPDVASAGGPGEDWHVLFDAVMFRLRRCVDDAASSVWTESRVSPAGRVRAQVVECVEALEQLRSALQPLHAGRRALESEAQALRVALAQARAELIGTQAGERQARHQALHDALTGLPNRRFFLERLEHALAHLPPAAPMLALLYLDLDGFKAVNDLHGHEAGDEMLRIVATRLNRAVRGEDMVSRLGGDEFGCLRMGSAESPLPPEQLVHLAEKLLEAVSAPMRIGQLTLTVHPSIGIAVYPSAGGDVAALLKSADAAMYRAKRQQTRHAFAA